MRKMGSGKEFELVDQLSWGSSLLYLSQVMFPCLPWDKSKEGM